MGCGEPCLGRLPHRALSVAKALSVRDAGGGVARGVDVDGLDKAIREVERRAGLDEITKSAQAIDSHVTKSSTGPDREEQP